MAHVFRFICNSLQESLEALISFTLHELNQLQNSYTITQEEVQQDIVFIIGQQLQLVEVRDQRVQAYVLNQFGLMMSEKNLWSYEKMLA